MKNLITLLLILFAFQGFAQTEVSGIVKNVDTQIKYTQASSQNMD